MPPVSVSHVVSSREIFQNTLGGVYEKTPEIAASAYETAKEATSVTQIAAAMKYSVDNLNEEKQIQLIKAHPDLAGRAALAGQLTKESNLEQSRAGLNSLERDELDRFQQLNSNYKNKFGFPFILAVRNANKRTILNAFEHRLLNTRAVEIGAAISQIHKIAWMRILDTVQPAPTGKLTCHVLDTARGCPAAGMNIALHRLSDGGQTRIKCADFVTNSDGRLPGGPALQGEAFTEGQYEWTFYVGEYFVSHGVEPVPGQPFLGEVPLRFGIDNPEMHYHVPLLCSPWSYSTYRGS